MPPRTSRPVGPYAPPAEADAADAVPSVVVCDGAVAGHRPGMARTARPVRLTCDDVLDARDALIWRAVRAARNDDGVQGDRTAAVELAASRLGIPADEITVRLHDAAIMLRDAGVLATMLHWVSRVNTTWVTQSAPRGSRRACAAADDPTAVFFPSARFAANAKAALIVIDTFDAAGCAAVAAAIRALLWEPAPPPEQTVVSSVAGVVSASRVTVTVSRTGDTIGVLLPGATYFRSWSGRPMQAAWLADVIERGAVHPRSELPSPGGHRS